MNYVVVSTKYISKIEFKAIWSKIIGVGIEKEVEPLEKWTQIIVISRTCTYVGQAAFELQFVQEDVIPGWSIQEL